MSVRGVVVTDVGAENPPQMAFTENNDVVQAFSPDGPDDPLDVRILPRRAWGSQHFIDTHSLHPSSEVVPVNPVTVTQQITRGCVPRKRFDELLRCPCSRGMLSDVEVDDVTATMGEHDEDEEHSESHGRDGEEIDGHQVVLVVGQERVPRLRGWLVVPQYVLRHSGLGD